MERALIGAQRKRMPQALAVRATSPNTVTNHQKALKILSRSIYKELRQNGYEPKQIVALATEIIGLVTSDMNADISQNAALD